MMELNSLRIDPKKSREGVWVDYVRGTRVLVARYDNKDMLAYKSQKAMEHKLLFTNMQDNMEEALRVSDEIDVEAMAQYMLLDWEGFSNNGEVLDYTPELGKQIFSDEMYEEFTKFVQRVGQNQENYSVEGEIALAESVKDTAAS